MKLVESVENALWAEFQTSKYKNVRRYIEKWHQCDYDGYNSWENFAIYETKDKNIDLAKTLHNIDGSTLLKIAIDLGVDTPDFIPSIPTFKNELKSSYITAYDTFTKAHKQIETDPSLAISLANSALESIIKEILRDERVSNKIKGTETLYDLTNVILKEFQLFPKSDMPKEIKMIGSSLLAVNQGIEKLRSEKTNVHGKTTEDYIIQDSLYAHFVVNSVTSVGLFLNSFYKSKFPKAVEEKESGHTSFINDLPF